MSFFTVLSVASAVGQAFASYQQGQAMKAYYESQADLTRLQYDARRVEAKEAGVRALRETNKAIGAIVARGAAGGITTDSGSVLLQQTISIREGVEDYRMSAFNQRILNNLGAVEFRNLQAAGAIAEQQGTMGGLLGLGTDIAEINQAGLFSGFGTSPSKALEATPTTPAYDYEGGILGAIERMG